MLKTLLIGGLSLAAFAPALAHAQTPCQDAQRDNRVAGTVLGAVGGALLGGAVSDGNAGGVVLGGLGGAVAGNVIAGAATNCGNQYGYYDSSGRWTPAVSNAQGYYDYNGRWVASAYSAPPPPSANGYYDSSGRWVAYAPPAANGYYDSSGRWVASARPAANGYYDSSGRWVAYAPTAANGYYDRSGRWVASAPTAANGYYDRSGRWVAYGPPAASGYGSDAAYTDRGRWADAPMDTRQREDWLDRRIRDRMAEGTLAHDDGRQALRELANIRYTDARYRAGDGGLSGWQQAEIERRLDSLRDRVRAVGDTATRTY